MHSLHQRGDFLEGYHEVYFGTEPVGKVQIKRSGLYYDICCRCTLTGDSVYRLWVQWSDRQENLGVVIPEGENCFCLKRRIPAKHFNHGPARFFLAVKREAVTGQFVPICPEEPFLYIHRLNEAFLENRNGKLGIVIPEKTGTD